MKTKTKVKNSKLTPVFTMIESAWKIYWQNINKFIRLLLWSLIGFLPLFFLSLVAFCLQDIWGINSLGLQVSLAVLVTFSLLWLAYYFARVYVSLFLMIKNNFKKKTWEQFKESRMVVWSYISLIFLTIIFLSPLFLIGLAFMVSINLLPMAPMVLAMLLFCALILFTLAFILVIFFGVSTFSLVFENLNGLQALKRSMFLVERYWWAVLGRMLFFALIIWVFSLLLSFPLALASTDSAFYRAWQGIVNLVQILISPIYLLYMVQVYRDLVKIKGPMPKKS